jgi:hypothetical protein
MTELLLSSVSAVSDTIIQETKKGFWKISKSFFYFQLKKIMYAGSLSMRFRSGCCNHSVYEKRLLLEFHALS